MFGRVILFPFIVIIFVSALYAAWVHVAPVSAAEATAPASTVPISISAADDVVPSFTYSNHTFGFSVTYPSSMLRNSNASLGASYDDAFKDGALILALYLPSQAPYVAEGGEGALRIGIANDPTSVADCTQADGEGIYEGTSVIGGETFSEFSYPDAGIDSYRIVHAGSCYALEIQVKPIAGSQYDSDAQAAKAMLESVLATFNFS